MTTATTADIGEITRALRTFVTPGGVVELRAPKVGGRKRTDSGYYADLDALARDAASLSGKAPGVYVTLNTLDPNLLARRANRLETYADQTTADHNIVRRRFIPIDLDPTRPAGISSSAEEHELALARARDTWRWLEARGVPTEALIACDSGNGAHILVHVDLPADTEAHMLVERVLQAAAFALDDDAVHVDTTLANAARIIKLPGTLTAKGDDVPDRPHRPARLLRAPSPGEMVPASRDVLERIAATLPRPERVEVPRGSAAWSLDRWLAEHRVDVLKPRPWKDGRKWIFNVCPWNADHTDDDAYVLEHGNGAVAAGCVHNGCSGKTWRDLRLLYEPDAYKPGLTITTPPSMGASMGAIGAYFPKPESMASMGTHGQPERRVRLTSAASIKPKPVRWLYEDRIPAGELGLTPGRGGVGKSTFHTWLHASLTRGTLPGIYQGTPRAVIIAAAEDSWSRTIVPRLMAAGADLALVYRVDVVTDDLDDLSLTLPADCDALEAEISRIGAVLLSIDPIMSAIGINLDTHKDRDVRQALEPVARIMDRTGCTALGNAHFNKGSGSDPLALVMGSAAFGNVVRTVLGFARDPQAEDGSCVISQVKNNLGRLDIPSLRYVIEPASIDTDEGPAEVGRLVMLGESDRSVVDILRDAATSEDSRAERSESQTWLREYLRDAGGTAYAADVLKDGRAAGLSENAIKKARAAIGATSTRAGFGRDAYYRWALESVTLGVDDGAKHPARADVEAPSLNGHAPAAVRVEMTEEFDL